jgi:hypothetical protein
VYNKNNYVFARKLLAAETPMVSQQQIVPMPGLPQITPMFGTLAADVAVPHAEHLPAGWFKLSGDENDYFLSLAPIAKVHSFLQAAALRFYPERQLLVRTRSNQQVQSIRMWRSKDSSVCKFDLAQVWSLQSPSSYTTQYGFRRALLGEPQETPVAELCVKKYKSMKFFNYGCSEKNKLAVAMSAEDILKFLLSDFARKGQYDEIFEDLGSKVPAEQVCEVQTGVQTLQEQSPAAALVCVKSAQPPPPPPKTPPPSPRRVFTNECVERMRELQHNLTAAAEIELTTPEGARKRRKLAQTAMASITRVLFDGHKFVLDSMLG